MGGIEHKHSSTPKLQVFTITLLSRAAYSEQVLMSNLRIENFWNKKFRELKSWDN